MVLFFCDASKQKMNKILAFILFLMTVSLGYGQETGGIRGHISDAEATDEALLFAHVALTDTNRSVQTNFHGNFEFSNVKAGDYVLTVQYPGYETLEIPVTVKENEQSYISSSLLARSPDSYSATLSETVSSLGTEK